MNTIERRRYQPSVVVLQFVMAALAAATVACGSGDGIPREGSAASSAATTVATSSAPLMELQSALPAGNAASWYTQRLSELDYEILRLRQERGGVSSLRVRKEGDDFDVRIALDSDGGVANSVEIAPVEAPESTVDAGSDESAIGPVATAAKSRAAGPPAGPASRDSAKDTAGPLFRDPAGRVDTRLDPAPEAPREPAPRAAGAPSEPVAPPRVPEPGREPVEAPTPPPPPEPRSYTVRVPTGTLIAARLDTELNSGQAQVGDGFAMHVSEAVWVDGVEVLPAGTAVWGYIAEVERAGRPNKGGRLVLATDSVQVAGEAMALDAIVSADGERLEGRDSAREDVKEVAIGAGLGGLVGGLLGGKKGVLVGVLAGGGGTFVATKGEEVEIPRDAPLSLELRRDLTVTFVDAE